MASSPAPVNPLAYETPVSGTASLQQYYAFAAATLSREEWSKIRLELQSLVHEFDSDSVASINAAQATKSVLAPKEAEVQWAALPPGLEVKEEHDRFIASLNYEDKAIRADFFKQSHGRTNVLRIEYFDGTKTEISVGYQYIIRSVEIYRSQAGEIFVAIGSHWRYGRGQFSDKIEVFDLRKSHAPVFTKDYSFPIKRFDFGFFEHEGSLFLAAQILPEEVRVGQINQFTEFFEPLRSNTRTLSFSGPQTYRWMGVREVGGQPVLVYRYSDSHEIKAFSLFNLPEGRAGN